MITSTTSSVRVVKIRAAGLLLAALIAAFLLVPKSAHASTTFTVVNTNDSGSGSLRQAIHDANNMQGADIIEFDIPGIGVHTIAPASQLPTITGPVTINGYSQPGASPNQKAVGGDAILKIALSGAGAQNGYGLELGGANSTVKGLVIYYWNQGIRIDGSSATGNRIAGNYIGTDASGMQGLRNGVGVRVYEGSNNTIGGTTPAARNVISGNGNGVGIGDGGPDTTGNKVIGNYIGTDATGTRELGNDSNGIGIEDSTNVTTNSIIGGTMSGERNVISGNDESGVRLSGSGSKVLGNFIGTDATGTKDLGNAQQGVHIDFYGSNNTVGGTTAGERNLISGNEDNGVRIEGAGTKGNKVAGNFIGTDKTGAIDLGNSGSGVFISGAPNNVVGGVTAGERNVISANDVRGVQISGTGAAANRVAGNYIGTDASGTEDLGNYEQGVFISGAPDNVVGGTTAGERNVVSANDREGVLILGNGADGNRIMGNYIGTDKTGAAPLGNVDDGVFVYDVSNNTIGGTTAGAGNVISSSTTEDGVQIYGPNAAGNRILSNSIFANAGLGIELDNDGSTPNDPDDTDIGANYLQNFPLLSSARKNSSGTTTVRGKLNSTPNQTFRIEFFSNPKATDEGKTFLGFELVSTDGSGDAAFVFPTKKAIRLGQNVTATATGPGGNTSEFSAPKKVVAQ